MEWTGQVYADVPIVADKVYIDASPQVVWDLVTDIHLMPRLSDEVREVAWLDGASGPAPGHRFVGRNVHESLGSWETTCTVIECEQRARFAWAVGEPDYPSSVWRFTLLSAGQGTVLEQQGQMGPAPSGLSYAIEAMPDKEQKIVFVRLREFEAGIKRNLATIKQLAEQGK
ncbi:SRPBCC family protein [Nocardia sp. NPDC055029]